MDVPIGLFISGEQIRFTSVLSWTDKKLICSFKDFSKAEQ
jgi:hypothetical protein